MLNIYFWDDLAQLSGETNNTFSRKVHPRLKKLLFSIFSLYFWQHSTLFVGGLLFYEKLHNVSCFTLTSTSLSWKLVIFFTILQTRFHIQPWYMHTESTNRAMIDWIVNGQVSQLSPILVLWKLINQKNWPYKSSEGSCSCLNQMNQKWPLLKSFRCHKTKWFIPPKEQQISWK